MNKDGCEESCPICLGIKKCDVLFVKKIIYGDAEESEDGWKKYFVLQCRGCQEIFYMTEEWVPYMYDIGENYTNKKYFPPIPKVQQIVENKYLRKESCKPIRSLYIEIIKALNYGFSQLAIIGIRTLIDRIAMDIAVSGTDGSFSKNIRKLQEMNHISKSQLTTLETVLDAGNSVVHRNNAMKMRQVIYSFDIVQHLMQQLYVNVERVVEIKKSIPPRTSVKAK